MTLLPPAAAPAVAFFTNKAAAAALRAQKHKCPTAAVPAAMANAHSQHFIISSAVWGADAQFMAAVYQEARLLPTDPGDHTPAC